MSRSGIWVDTDFGFDDLWALMVLQAEGVPVDGVSLVAGNAPLHQVMRNARGARQVFPADWMMFAGVAEPLNRPLETAEAVLGPLGMQSRGQHLPQIADADLPPFETVMQLWLGDPQPRHDVLALGPLTNLAAFALDAPDAFKQIDRIVWMGGSSGRGNHTDHAEFNAAVDADALAHVASTGVQLDCVDLEACRTVRFGETDIPDGLTPLIADLVGGYLDIALQRGREQMAIYDPLAALAIADAAAVTFTPHQLHVDTGETETYGATHFSKAEDSAVSLATSVAPDAAARCLAALKETSL